MKQTKNILKEKKAGDTMGMKKRLSAGEDFEIMKLVMDKFLWLGFGIMAYGLYYMFMGASVAIGFTWLIVGSIVLILFMIIIVKEYEIIM